MTNEPIKQSPHGSAPLQPNDRDRLARFVEACGSKSAACRVFGIPVPTLVRALDGDNMRAGTRSLIRSKLTDLESWQRKADGDGDAA